MKKGLLAAFAAIVSCVLSNGCVVRSSTDDIEQPIVEAHELGDGGTSDIPFVLSPPVQSCNGVDDGTICELDQWKGQCVSGLCCWSCVANSPTEGDCPFMRDAGNIDNGQCVTGRCFVDWDNDLQSTTCR